MKLAIVLRQLSKQPGFSAVTVLTIGLCLAANLAIFAVVDAILLRPLPFPEADRLVVMYNSYPKIGRERGESSYLNYHSRRGAIQALSSVAAFDEGSSIVGEVGSTEALEVNRVSAEFFETLGVRPMLGRAFTEAEMSYATDAVAVLTDELWRTQFGADASVIGRTLRVDGVSRVVVGVLPAGFRFLSSRARLYLPLSADRDALRIDRLHNGGFEMIGRLAPGATLGDAQSQIDVHNASMNRDFPYVKDVMAGGFRTIVSALHGDHVRSIRKPLLLLQGGVFCLLLIGAVNLANLLLVRASSRNAEFAVRQALGAGRRHVLSQAILETMVLALCGCGLGWFLSMVSIAALGRLGVQTLPLGSQVAVNFRVLGVGLLMALAMGWVGGLISGAMGLRALSGGGLLLGARSGESHRSTQRLRHTFIVVQVAMALVLLIGAGLLGTSLSKVLAVSPGFRPEHLLTGRVALPWSHYRDGAARDAFISRLLDALEAQPGVTAVGVSTAIPMAASGESNVMRIPGHDPELANPPILHNRHGVTGRYFEALGIPLREGRYLETEDGRRSQRVCVVDEEFARAYWPGESALGKHVSEGPDVRDRSQWFTIVGVVGAVKQHQVTESTPGRAIYLPFVHNASGQIFVSVRTSADAAAFAVTLQKLVRVLDPELPASDVRTMDVRMEDRLVGRRSPVLLARLFALAALALAAIGTYGVLAYAVAQRRREIGVRMALGALPGQIGSQFLRLGAKLLLAGVVAGMLGGVLLGQAMRGLLFETPPFHLPTFMVAFMAMTLAMLAASLLPTVRAARTDPAIALKAE